MLKGKLICPCQITPRSFFGPTDVKPAASLFTLPGKSSRELPFSFHKTQSSIALLLLLSLPFRRSALKTIKSAQHSSQDPCVIPRATAFAHPHVVFHRLWSPGAAAVLGCPQALSAPRSRSSLRTGHRPPQTGAAASCLLSTEFGIGERAARRGGIPPL